MAGQEGGHILKLRIGAHLLEREEEQGKVLVISLGDMWRCLAFAIVLVLVLS